MKKLNRWKNKILTGPVALLVFAVAGTQSGHAVGADIDYVTGNENGVAIPAVLLDLQDTDAADIPPITTRIGPDHDGDGTDSAVDPDDDDDRISDIDEGLIDADADGVPDPGSIDTDGDGVVDGLDDDSDNDGIPDWDEAVLHSSSGTFSPIDTDGDGVMDFRDLDSDGDGIMDLVEAGGTDADGDGLVDNFTDTTGKGIDDGIHASSLPVFDTDIDGEHDYRDLDSDNDSIPDNVEAGPNPLVPADTDSDGAADYREQDSDSDTIPDSVEAGTNPAVPVDTDSDGAPDYTDTDSDNDTLLDSAEAGGSPATPVDTDSDGAPDYQDLDSNNDGTQDGGGSPPASGPDTDGDGIRNQDDLDDDNDGILDVDEGAVDADNNGFLDPSSVDTDGDGTPDAWDLDSDNDGILDLWEASTNLPLMASLDQVVNGAVDIAFPVGANGIPDALETSPDSGVLTIAPVTDTDGDGTQDFRDIDSDADGIFDLIEAGGTDTDANGMIDGLSIRMEKVLTIRYRHQHYRYSIPTATAHRIGAIQIQTAIPSPMRSRAVAHLICRSIPTVTEQLIIVKQIRITTHCLTARKREPILPTRLTQTVTVVPTTRIWTATTMVHRTVHPLRHHRRVTVLTLMAMVSATRTILMMIMTESLMSMKAL